MPKHYKEMMDEIINKMPVEESNRYSVKFAYKKGDKIANSFYKDKSDAEKFVKSVIAKGGKAILTTEDAPANAVGTGANVALPPAVEPGVDKKKKKDTIVMGFKKRMDESDDNNNVVLKGILDKLDKIDESIDRLSGIEKTQLEFVQEEEEYKSFRDKYNAKDI